MNRKGRVRSGPAFFASPTYSGSGILGKAVLAAISLKNQGLKKL
jgi:hypothetical protein